MHADDPTLVPRVAKALKDRGWSVFFLKLKIRSVSPCLMVSDIVPF